MFDKYLHFSKHGRRLAENTLLALEADYRSYTKGDRPEPPTRASLEGWIIDQQREGISLATIRRRLSTIKLYMDWLIANGHHKGGNPAQGPGLLPRGEEEQRGQTLTKAQIDGLLEVAKDPVDILAVGLMGYLALRVHEAAAVKGTDITEGWITVKGKGGKTREVPTDLLPDKARQALDSLYNPSYLLQGQRGGLSANGLYRRITALLEQQGLAGAGTHALRRGALTDLMMQGANPEAIRRLAGHSSLATLAQYTRPDRAGMLAGLGV